MPSCLRAQEALDAMRVQETLVHQGLFLEAQRCGRRIGRWTSSRDRRRILPLPTPTPISSQTHTALTRTPHPHPPIPARFIPPPHLTACSVPPPHLSLLKRDEEATVAAAEVSLQKSLANLHAQQQLEMDGLLRRIERNR